MRLTALTVSGFKNLKDVSLHPDAHYNVIVGENAQGKTNLLEAIRSLINDKRDWADSHRAAAPLQAAADAVTVDTTHMDFQQSMDAILQEIRKRVR